MPESTVPDWLVDDSLAPNPEGALAPLYEAAGRGELALPHCAACAVALELDQLRCDVCGATEIAWRVVQPTGSVHSSTTVHRREPGLIRTPDPYHLVDVELDSGHRLLVTTAQPTSAAPAIGAPARVVFRTVAGVAVPALALPPSDPETA